jgi:LAO/AO transport system kinase
MNTGTDIADAIVAGDRRALARAVTLVESTREDHRQTARALVSQLKTRGHRALRIGLTGTPGVGKSTFIEALGLCLCDAGKRVAVLAVDPSSRRTGGAILGDKTRMPQLSRRKEAFIRPSPSSNTLGGVAAQSREVIELCEAAGFDIILVETVGVGQSEVMVADMTDIFALLIAPAGGDELQGVKRGIMELADLVLVNKADGDLKPQAVRTAADYAGALRLLARGDDMPPDFPKALTLSALTGEGLSEVYDAMDELAHWRDAQGHTATRRATQSQMAFEHALERELRSAARNHPQFAALKSAAVQEISSGAVAPEDAAKKIARQIIFLE